ncbi:5-formyltetrahydrofolate cyclo-ligase [Populibacterium corticicola]|uniref:5-formyltetrahydrofolate cyclo-ligase n=1 Tax=Populibacterium corticicola TaxID=1812826 RepID=A0ABW5XI86_9MICO
MAVSRQPYPSEDFTEIEDFKSALRTAIREQRANRSERLRREAAQDFATVLLSIPEVKDAHTVALYASRNGEPSTLPILNYLQALDKQILLPVLGSGLQRGWAPYVGEDDLLERAPGRPPEPSTPHLSAEALQAADVIIAPALAVDSRGVRLGQGGGWYDRALLHARAGVQTIALVYPEEIYDAATMPLPHEDHDLPVHAVATTTHWATLPLSGL